MGTVPFEHGIFDSVKRGVVYIRKPFPDEDMEFLWLTGEQRVIAVAIWTGTIDGDYREYRIPITSVGEMLEWIDLVDESRRLNPARWGCPDCEPEAVA